MLFCIVSPVMFLFEARKKLLTNLLVFIAIFSTDLMEELTSSLQPAMSLVQGKKIASPQLIQFVRTKYHLVNK